MSKKSPSDFLQAVLGRPVLVKLNSGIEYRGVLACLDGYMNIAMEQTEEYMDDQLKTKFGDAFIRGNNGSGGGGSSGGGGGAPKSGGGGGASGKPSSGADGGSPGKPSAGVGGDSPGKPGAGSPGKPDAGSPGKPDAGSPGKPGGGSPGKPDAGYSGKPGAGSPGKPGAGSPGKPDAGSPGKPDAGSPGKPGAGSPGKPGAGSPGKPGAGGGSPGKTGLGHLSSSQQAKCNQIGKQCASLEQQRRTMKAQGKGNTPEFKAKTEEIQKLKSSIKSIAGSDFDVDTFVSSTHGGGDAVDTNIPSADTTNPGSTLSSSGNGSPANTSTGGAPSSSDFTKKLLSTPGLLNTSDSSVSTSVSGNPGLSNALTSNGAITSSPGSPSGSSSVSGSTGSSISTGVKKLSTADFSSLDVKTQADAKQFGKRLISKETDLNKLDKNDKNYAAKAESLQNEIGNSQQQLQKILGSDVDVSNFLSSFVDSSFKSNNSVSGTMNNDKSMKMSSSQFSLLDTARQSEAKEIGKKIISKQAELNNLDRNDKNFVGKSDTIQRDINNAQQQLNNIIGANADVNDFLFSFVDSSVSGNVNAARKSLRRMSTLQFSQLDAGTQSQAKEIGKKIISKQMELNNLNTADSDFVDKSGSLRNELTDLKKQLRAICGADIDIKDFITNFVDGSFSNIAPNDFESDADGAPADMTQNFADPQSAANPSTSANPQDAVNSFASANPQDSLNTFAPANSQDALNSVGSANPQAAASPANTFANQNVRRDLIPTNEAVKMKIAEFAKMNQQEDEAAARSLLDTAKFTEVEKKSALMIRANFKASAWTALQFELKSDFASLDYQHARDAAFLAMDSYKNMLQNLSAGAIDLDNGSDASRDCKMFMLSSLASMLSLIQ